VPAYRLATRQPTDPRSASDPGVTAERSLSDRPRAPTVICLRANGRRSGRGCLGGKFGSSDFNGVRWSSTFAVLRPPAYF